MNILRNLWNNVNRPLPAWLTLTLILGASAVAAVPTYTGQIAAYTTTAGTVPLTVKGASTGTANLANFNNSSGSNLANIDYLGDVTAVGGTFSGGLSVSGGKLYVTNGGILQTSGASTNLMQPIALDGLGAVSLRACCSLSGIGSTGPLESTTTTTATPGPVPPCFGFSGNACPYATEHIVHGIITDTYSGSCTAHTTCTMTNGGVAGQTLTGAAVFTSASTYVCSGIDENTNALLVALPASGTGFFYATYNAANSTISGSTAASIVTLCEGH